MATLNDVAEKAGVSVSLVSRVLSAAPRTRVSDSTRQRIHIAARDLGYRPNFAARALKSARTHVFGLVVPDLTNAIFTELTAAVEDEARKRGYMVLLARTEGLMRDRETIPRLVGEGRVDGVLVQAGDAMDEADIAALTEGTSPVVFVNSAHPGGTGTVLLDDEAGARAATEHLIQLGHENIAFIGGLPGTDSARRRLAGFTQSMRAAGLRVRHELMTELGYLPEQGREALAQLISLSQPPSAVVVANVNAAYGALLEARARGVGVPDQLSVIAIHDAWTADNTWPPLTTVRMPLAELGRASVEALVERIESDRIIDRVVRAPAPQVITRASTSRPTPVQD